MEKKQKIELGGVLWKKLISSTGFQRVVDDIYEYIFYKYA